MTGRGEVSLPIFIGRLAVNEARYATAMPAIVFVRHSTPRIDPTVPSTDWTLSDAGVAAARELAEALNRFAPSSVLTSPEDKARGTAAIIAARCGVPVIVDEDLREHERASAGFLPVGEFNQGIETLLRSTQELVFGDETAEAVFLRLKAAVDRATRCSPDRNQVFVSHGTAISIYAGRIMGCDPVELWRDLRTPTALIIRDGDMERLAPPGANAR